MGSLWTTVLFVCVKNKAYLCSVECNVFGMAKIDVNGVAVTVVKMNSEDYISLTDMMRSRDGEFFP